MLFWLEKLIPDWSGGRSCGTTFVGFFSSIRWLCDGFKVVRFFCVEYFYIWNIYFYKLSLTCWDLIDVTIAVEDANPKLDALIDVDLGV